MKYNNILVTPFTRVLVTPQDLQSLVTIAITNYQCICILKCMLIYHKKPSLTSVVQLLKVY